MPIKEYRDYDYYHCPQCGDPSFFKIESMCRNCMDMAEYDLGRRSSLHMRARARRRVRRKYFKNIQKRIEYLILPFLVLIGKAWYVRSLRRHFEDYYEDP